jgi:uncharacterized protein YlxW (UPF0749 family)
MVADQRVGRRTPEPPPHAAMGLLNYITATSLDEDYAHVSRRRAAAPPSEEPEPSRRRPGWVGLVVVAAFGVLVATAAVQTQRTAGESASSRESLVKQVNARKADLASLRTRAAQLSQKVAALQDNDLAATTQGRAVQGRLARLGVAAGAVTTVGPGIRLRLDDAPGAVEDSRKVHGQDVQKIVNALWLIGAEAISINGQRLTALSSIRDAGTAITVNFVSLRPPYAVQAIGNRKTMAARLLDTAGGQTWVTLQSSFGLRFDITNEDSMTLPAAKPASLRWAHRPEREVTRP